MALTDKDKLQSLEFQLQEAKARIAELEGQVGAAQVRTVPAPSSMPSNSQLASLFRIITVKFRVLAPKPSEADDALDRFKRVFQYIARNCGRTPPGQMNKYSNATWADRASEWLRARQMPDDVSIASLVIACIACDCETTLSSRFPLDLELGVTLDGNGMGTAWQKVINGHIRQPLAFMGGRRVTPAPTYEQLPVTMRVQQPDGSWRNEPMPGPRGW